MLKNPKKPKKAAKKKDKKNIKQKVSKKIDSELLNEFVSNNVSKDILKKKFKIDAKNVFQDNFRINVWTLHTEEDKVVPTINLSESFFVELTDSGEIIDLTIRKG